MISWIFWVWFIGCLWVWFLRFIGFDLLDVYGFDFLDLLGGLWVWFLGFIGFDLLDVYGFDFLDLLGLIWGRTWSMKFMSWGRRRTMFYQKIMKRKKKIKMFLKNLFRYLFFNFLRWLFYLLKCWHGIY